MLFWLRQTLFSQWLQKPKVSSVFTCAHLKCRSLLKFEKFFDDKTDEYSFERRDLSTSKEGGTGNLELVRIGDKKIGYQELSRLVKEISEESRSSESGSIEISRTGATVIQLGKYRIAITRTPFSDGLEATIVKPIAKLTIDDYGFERKTCCSTIGKC